MSIETCCRTIFGVLNPWISFDGVYCQIRAYFLYVFVSNVIYSFVVQAIFQLFRVAFHQKRALRTFRVFTIAIILQWIFVCVINLTFFPLHDFVYVSSEYRCLVTFTNQRGSIMAFLFAYIIPGNVLFTIYFFILRFVRQTNHAIQNRQLARQRDLIVLKRIIILFIIFQLFYTPFAVIWIIYVCTGHLVALTYQLQGLIVGLSHVFITIMITFGTPQMREKLKCRRWQVQPIARITMQPIEITERIRMRRF